MPTIPNVPLPAETVAQLLALTPAERLRVADYLAADTAPADDAPPDDPEEVRAAWKAEIARRVEQVRSGNYVSYTPEEVDDHIRRVLEEEDRRG